MRSAERGHGPEHGVSVKITCPSGHTHELCVRVRREVHPHLRCSLSGGGGVTLGGSTCVPADLVSRVEHELGNNYQETFRRGWVSIRL